ncbi:alpha/beta hydrolase [Armatimonas sp.]|uniref:alpha/beta hydrolase n=1 Tax=Armatimonas sp. TaxID=1872638 RepID=UPI00286CF42A|nr:alpha/beta hydrolase [Armatimonas sp.]
MKLDTLTLWPGKLPGASPVTTGPEADLSKPGEGMTGGKAVIRLGNVSQPELHVYLPSGKRTGAGIVICPGGGYNILAWNLEGTEIAQWLNKQGIAAFVLKYRVPTGALKPNWEGPTMDAQRALRLVRANASKWGVASDKLGILGFSAGGKTAGMAALQNGKSLYEEQDEADKLSCRPDFAVLVYPAYFCDNNLQLQPEYAAMVTKDLPPFFFAHAADDGVTCQSSVQLFTALRKVKVPAELHVWESGGHGYGMRPQKDKPIPTAWPKRCEEWMKARGLG